MGTGLPRRDRPQRRLSTMQEIARRQGYRTMLEDSQSQGLLRLDHTRRGHQGCLHTGARLGGCRGGTKWFSFSARVRSSARASGSVSGSCRRPPLCQARGGPFRGLNVLKAGRCTAINVIVLKDLDRDIPSEVGLPTSFHWYGSYPIAFFFAFRRITTSPFRSISQPSRGTSHAPFW